MKRILINAAMDKELKGFLELLGTKQSNSVVIDGYTFYEFSTRERSYVLGLTGIGKINATLSTYIALSNYDIDLVVNYGLAGAHLREMTYNALVLPEAFFNAECVTYSENPATRGIQIDYYFTDVEASSWSPTIEVDASLRARAIAIAEEMGLRVFGGKCASADSWRKSTALIDAIHDVADSSIEEMEGYAVAFVCKQMSVPMLSVRVVSNNEITGLNYDSSSASAGVDFVLELVKNL